MICENSRFLLHANLFIGPPYSLVFQSYFRTFQPAGILDPSTSPRDGIFDPTQDPMTHQGIGGWPDVPAFELLERVHASDSYLRFLEHPDLRAFVRKLMGWEKEFLLPRAMLRHNCPGSFSTGMHYDQIFLRKGPPTFLTGWVPIGDCAANGGGLMYLEDSSALGKEIEAEFNQAAQVLTPEERISAFNQHMAKSGCIPQDPGGFAEERAKSSRWLVGNFEAGDIVFHDPYMIHASTNNSDKLGRIRLASDLRFYEAGTDIDERWLKLFTRNDGL